MTKRAKLAAAAGGGLLALGLIAALLPGREPTYDGLTMGQWRNRRDAQTEEALLALGTNNLSLLVKRLNYEPERDLYARFAIRVYKLSRSRWVYDIASRRNILAEDAHSVFYRLGPKAAPAVPQLAKLVERGPSSPRSRALSVLASVGEGGLAVVASHARTNSNPETRLLAVELLAWTSHTESRLAFLALTNAMADTNSGVRKAAWQAISNHLQWNPNLTPAERTRLRSAHE